MKRVCLSIVLLAAMVAAASAQEFRGAITGRISDQSGGALPGVTVTATNVATNVATNTTSGGEGDYNILYLTPGTYTVTAELSGFKKLLREGIQVRIGDRIGLDLKMEIGRVDGNPFTLSRIVPGVAYTGDLKFSRPFDNGGTSSINADGSTGGNEFSLDGSPNMANGRRVAFVPPAGAVQEFKVSTASFDAAEGHTAGALVNVTLKSGTNRLNGEAYEYMRRDRWSSTDFFVKKAGTAKPKVTYDRPGFHLGGPVDIPGVYNGHDKTFFFGAVEWLYDEFPEPGPRTVPSEAMRHGDLSELLAQNVIIYDPRTAQQVGSRVVRQPFPGNIVPPDRISPIAQQLLKYFPTPNQAGTLGTNNYFSTNPRTDDFYSI
jgi:hypothetical protein